MPLTAKPALLGATVNHIMAPLLLLLPTRSFGPWPSRLWPISLSAMPKIDFTDEERRALADVAREYVRTQRYPLAPRLAPIKAALAKLAPNDELPPPPGQR